MSEHRFPYEWRIADGYPAPGIDNHGCKVFGTFICGGGSSMGYKLAGYHHIGGVEIDPNIAAIYNDNHNPDHLYIEDLRKFNERTDLPDELYSLDVLDGSPPCSTFSVSGSREDAWGKEKRFAEGQALQTLDDLVFVYCDTIIKLRPKVFVLENVKGLATGNAKSYLKRIVMKLRDGGYVCQVFILNAATMGVPQKRERVFVIGHKKEFDVQRLNLDFHEKPILFGDIIDHTDKSNTLTAHDYELWSLLRPTDKRFADVKIRNTGRESLFNYKVIHRDEVCYTIPTVDTLYLADYPRKINETEIKKCGSYPMDYKADGRGRILWLAGMSVPPVMMANISYEIYQQWLKPIKGM